MELIRLLTLCLSYTAVVARPKWDEKPGILVSRREIDEGDTTTITCLLPIIYTGGTCRLYRKNSSVPFRQIIAHTYDDCDFLLTSSELLEWRQPGRVVRFKCDYALQQYTSVFSDSVMLVVWGRRPSPSLSIGRHIVSTEDIVEVTCTPPPQQSPSYCEFYKDKAKVKSASCTYNMLGSQLVILETPAVLTAVNLTCRYIVDSYFRSEFSNHHMMFVVDAAQATSSMVCLVSPYRGEGEWFDGSRGSVVTVRASSSDQQGNNTCVAASHQTSPEESASGP